MTNSASLTVFVAEDDLFCLHLYQQYLVNAGISRIAAFSGQESLPLEQNPDIIFLGHELNGEESYSQVKQIKQYDPGIYVVILSSKHCEVSAATYFGKGAFEILLKDEADSAVFRELIHRIISIKKQLGTARQLQKNGHAGKTPQRPL